MEQRRLGDKFIAEIVDAVKDSDKREDINLYIEEVAQGCVLLCKKGEHLRVLNEYKILLDNIRKELNL